MEKMKIILKTFILFYITFNFLQSEVVRVPNDRFQTIQDAIDFAFEGDTVIVKNGIYKESLSFYGISFVLSSEYLFSRNKDDIQNTIIEGNDASVLNISGVNKELKVIGFTLKKGANFDGSGGISIENSITNFENNILKDNLGSVGAINIIGGVSQFKDMIVQGNVGFASVIVINDSAKVSFDNIYFEKNINLFGRAGFITISNFSNVSFKNFSYLNNYNIHNTEINKMPVPGFLLNWLKNQKKSDIPKKTAEGIQLFNGSKLIVESSLIWSNDKQQIYFPIELELEEEDDDENENKVIEKSTFVISNSSFKGYKMSIKINDSNSVIDFHDDVINSLENKTIGYID